MFLFKRSDSPVPSSFEGARHVDDITGAEEIFEDRELWYVSIFHLLYKRKR